MSRSRSFRGRHFRMTSKLVFVAISVVLRECSAAASPSSSATETVSPSVSPSPSFTPLPCPSSGCVPWLGPSVSNGTCNFNSDQCARGQCNLAVQIPFAYFNTSLSADYVNLVATIDGLTWWHTSNGADIGSRAKNIITLSDGCFGSGNEWLTIAVCLTKASDFFPENTPKFNCLATSNCVLEPQGICIPPPGLANGTNPPPVPPYCDPVTKQFNINYASNHISICGSTSTEKWVIIVAVIFVLILIGAGYTLRHFGNKNNEKARVRKERLRLLRKGLKPRAPEASQVIADGFAEEKQSADARGTGSEDEELMERLLDDAYWEMNTDAAAAAIARDEDASSSCTDDDVA